MQLPGPFLVDGLRWIELRVRHVPSQQTFIVALATLAANGGSISSPTPTGVPTMVHSLPDRPRDPQAVRAVTVVTTVKTFA
ncbi:hypothetical protein GCM10009780_13040 [Actinomadura alba]